MQRCSLVLCALISTAAGCPMGSGQANAITLSEAGSRVVSSPSPPPPDCENKGSIIGEETSSSSVASSEHARLALDDARNKTAAAGGNYLQTTAPQLSQSKYGPTGAIVMGTAFLCRNQGSAQPSASPGS